MEILTKEDFQREISGDSEIISKDQFREDVAMPEEQGMLANIGDTMKEYGLKALDYMANPQEGPALNTYNIRKERYRPYVEQSFQQDIRPTYTEQPSLDEDYIQALTQRMMDEEGLTPGESVKVLRKLKELTGKPIGGRESLIVRRYLKNPNKWSGISPVESLTSGAAKMGAGVGQTGAGMVTGIGDLAETVGMEDVGQGLQEFGEDWASRFGAYRDIQKERTGSDMLGEVGAIAPMMLPTRMATTFGTTYGYGRGQGMGEGQSAITGAIDATMVGALNRLLGGKKSITASELRDKGLGAFDKNLITTDASDLIERIEKTTGKSVNDIIKQTADYMDTIGRESLTEDQIVRMAIQNITGGADYSPRAGKYLMGAESLNSTTAPVIMKEAQERTNDVRQALSKNPKLAELMDSFTIKIGNFEATDWQGLGEALRDFGIPADSELLQRVAKYGNIDDITTLKSMQGANPVATKNVSRVGQRESWESQAKAELYDKIRQAVYARIPGVNKDAKIEQAIINSLKDPTINPSKLKQQLVEAGIPASKISDEAIDAAFDEAVGKFPKENVGTAGEQGRDIPLIDEAELDSRINWNIDPNRVDDQWPMDRIINEFKDYGEDLDVALQEGLDQGLSGGKLRNYIYTRLRGASAQGFNPELARETVGAQAGWEVDDEGNISYDPVKGVAGAAIGGLTRPSVQRGIGDVISRGLGQAPAKVGDTSMRDAMFLTDESALKFLAKRAPEKVDDFKEANRLALEGVDDATIEARTGIPTINGRPFVMTENVVDHMDTEQLARMADTAATSGQTQHQPMSNLVDSYGSDAFNLSERPFLQMAIEPGTSRDAYTATRGDIPVEVGVELGSFNRKGKTIPDDAFVENIAHEGSHVGGFSGGDSTLFESPNIADQIAESTASRFLYGLAQKGILPDDPQLVNNMAKALKYRMGLGPIGTNNTIAYIMQDPYLRPIMDKIRQTGNNKELATLIKVVEHTNPYSLYRGIEGERFANTAGKLYGSGANETIDMSNNIGQQIKDYMGRDFDAYNLPQSLTEAAEPFIERGAYRKGVTRELNKDARGQIDQQLKGE